MLDSLQLTVISLFRQANTKRKIKAADKIKKEEEIPPSPLQVVEYDVSDEIFCEKCGELYKSDFSKVSGFNWCNQNTVLQDVRCEKKMFPLVFFSNPDR